MAERVGYRLAARSPFHIGERGVGIEETSLILHSDTLFSALCLTLRELGEDLESFLGLFPRVSDKWEAKPVAPMRLTSAFPYAGACYFFPKPMLRFPGLGDSEGVSTGKTLKRIQFVSRPILEALLAGESVARFLLKGSSGDMSHELLLQGGKAWVAPEELEPLQALQNDRTPRLWQQGAASRVTVDRVTSTSEVYAAGQVRFGDHCGLFFLVDYEDASLRPKIEKALRVLGDQGVGGERSSGHGQFALEIVEGFSLKEPPTEQTSAFTTLSLYWPTHDEVQNGVLDNSQYALINRRGWISSPDAMNLRRRSVRMLKEGAVCGKCPEGALADVTPLDPSPAPPVPHPVWRYGLAFALACREEKGGEL